MSGLSINSLSGTYLQSILATQGGSGTSSADGLSARPRPDESGLSPFAQMLSTLQQLQQNDPDKYKQVTGQIATSLTDAAQQAQADGKTQAADRLNQLAGDFSNASQSGQLPDISDLASAVTMHGIGRHHHHGHMHAPPASGSGDSDSGDSTGTSATQTLTQALAAYQSGNLQNDAFDPAGIIMSTVSDAGVSGA